MFVSKAYPSNYIQEQGVLHQTGDWVKKYGKHPLIIAGRTAWAKAGVPIERSLRENGLDYQLEYFEGHCSDQELERLLRLADSKVDLVLGVGGGQCLDTAKLVANRLGLSVINVSTLASTCAASSALSIIYTPEHVFERMEEFDRSPVLALVDPDIIREAPQRYLTAGIGDTIVKWYEANPLNIGKDQNARTKAGLKMAELIRDLLFDHSETAIHDCERGVTGEALRQVIDCNVFLAGLVGGLGRDTCASSGAHAIHYGMTVIPGVKGAYHGELVAYGLLCQFKLEGKTDEEISQMMKFYQKINLPITLFDLGMTEVNETQVHQAAVKACAPDQAIHNLPFPIKIEDVAFAIKYVHSLGESIKQAVV
ncbi:iron-containing alcohol dehydrogenase family protein [Ammoniphilus sp. CFH 90114]|uniref:iron-containing alcohol dehydrogenase family protein n=1 Tax=Ammoniphilus sp. CFH 90114 TaxID=2493665 RepID=UPI00100FEB1A|nr:iron-containing alcohol dehydrogenase family protein [Ammoniphilus sp. CFH 90114]RXT07196.1 iron-containing alcohol dehydrogenase family protein [Ammoniphilus sp. CFH 90114]